jgi:hypothetical protein
MSALSAHNPASRSWSASRDALSRLGRKLQPSSLRWPVVVGLLVRLVLAPIFAFDPDDSLWVRISSEGAYHLRLHARPGFSYPPGWGHVLQVLGELLAALGLPASSFGRFAPAVEPLASRGHFDLLVPSPLFDLVMKLPLFAFDVGTALVVYAVVSHLTSDDQRSRNAFALYFLTPFVIFESSVLGHFDVVVAFFVVLAVACVLADRPLGAGVALGIGTAVKGVPLIVLPLAALMLVLRARRQSHSSVATVVRRLGVLLVAFVAVEVVCDVPDLENRAVSTVIAATGARLSSQVSGGFSLFGLSIFKGLGGLHTVVADSPLLVHSLAVAILALFVVVACIALVRDGRPTTFLLATAGVFAVLFLTSPVTQPQYLVWIMPLLVILVVSTRAFRFETLVFSFAPVVFLLFVFGPGFFLIPFDVYARPGSVHDAVSAAFAYNYQRGASFWAAAPRDLVDSFMVPLGLAAELILTLRLLRAALAPEGAARRVSPQVDPIESSPSEAAESNRLVDPLRRRVRTGYLIAGIVPACSLIVAATIGAGAPSGSVGLLSAQRSRSADPSRLRLSLSYSPAIGQRSLEIVALPLRSGSSTADVHRVDVLSSPELVNAGTVVPQFAEHLTAEFSLRRLPVTVATIGVSQLRRQLQDMSRSAGTVIIDFTGNPLDSGVCGSGGGLLRAFVTRGGVLIWGGEPLSPGPGQPRSVVVAAASATTAMLRCVLPAGLAARCPPAKGGAQLAAAAHETAVGGALQLSFRSTAFGWSKQAIGCLHGEPIGWLGRRGSSVTAFPAGKGAVVVFAGQVLETSDLTHDLTSIIAAHAYDASGSASTLVLDNARARRNVMRCVLKLPSAASSATLELVAVDPDPLGTMLASWTLRRG